MLALLATLAIQALVSMAVLTPPVLAALAAPDIGVAAERVGLFTALIYGGAIVTSAGSGALLARAGPLRLSQVCLVFCALGLALGASGILLPVALGAILMGFGYGPVTPASSHILIRQTAPERRSFVFSLKQTGVPVGGAMAGSLAAPLAVAVGWRGAALAVAAMCVALAVVVEPLRPGFDGEDKGVARSSTGVLAGIRLVLQTASLRRLALSSTTFSATQLSFATFLVTFLTREARMSLVTAGAVMAVAQGGGIAGRIVFGWVADRLLPPNRLLALLGVGMAAASVATALISDRWPATAIFLVATMLGTTGISWNGVYLAEVARLAPPGAAGSATGGALSITFFGIVLGPALFGLVVSLSDSYALAFALLAAGALIGGLAVWGAAAAERLRR
ncbi:MAG TPA: MFS transporter [Stellaceae bacterium]|nr:MFS transporter [Stellaceae bacterium]